MVTKPLSDDCFVNAIYLADINECKVNKGGCVHKCTNIEGSFSCHCRIGYELSPDQRSCHSKYARLHA